MKALYREIRCIQGTDEWFESRLGLMTASNYGKLITKTGKPSAQWEDVINKCVAELMIGGLDEGFQSDSMIRGQSLEYEAMEFFNITTGFNFEKAGFLRAMNGDEELSYGCSPDGIDYEKNIGLELKCPLAHTHVKYLLNGKLPDVYKQQVQGSLLVSGFDKWIFGSYHPDMKCFAMVVERDEKYIATLKSIIDNCSNEILERLERLKVDEIPE